MNTLRWHGSTRWRCMFCHWLGRHSSAKNSYGTAALLFMVCCLLGLQGKKTGQKMYSKYTLVSDTNYSNYYIVTCQEAGSPVKYTSHPTTTTLGKILQSFFGGTTTRTWNWYPLASKKPWHLKSMSQYMYVYINRTIQTDCILTTICKLSSVFLRMPYLWRMLHEIAMWRCTHRMLLC